MGQTAEVRLMTTNEGSVKVSVIVLTFNHENYITQALESILMQKVDFRYEILVGDDASSDKTPEILQKYQRRYPEIVKITLRKENVGPTRNAYELFLSAQGPYLATCEGDDFWLAPDKLKRQIDFLEAHPEYIGCSHPSKIVDECGVPLKRQKLRWVCPKQNVTLNDFKGYFLPGQASSLVRRNIYRKYPDRDFSAFYKANSKIGDRTTALIYLSQGTFYRFKETMGCYRVVRAANSVTAKTYRNNKNWLAEDLAYTRRLMNYARETLHVDADFHFYLANLLISAVILYFKRPGKASRELISDVWNTAPSKGRTVLHLPEVLWKKVINRLFAI